MRNTAVRLSFTQGQVLIQAGGGDIGRGTESGRVRAARRRHPDRLPVAVPPRRPDRRHRQRGLARLNMESPTRPALIQDVPGTPSRPSATLVMSCALIIEEVDALPCCEVMVPPGRGFHILVAELGAETEIGKDGIEFETAVEIRAPDVHARIRENVGLPVRLTASIRRDADDRKVRCAATDVDDKSQFFGADVALVVEGGGNGFELELDVSETCELGRAPELILGVSVSLSVVVHEVDGAAHDNGVRPVGGIPHVAQEQSDDLVKSQALCPHLRQLVNERGAKHRFQGAHEAPILALQIAGDGLAAKGNARVLEAEEYRGRNRSAAVLQRDKRGWLSAA